MPQQTLDAAVAYWLSQFERALSSRDETLLASLFHTDCHWRDVAGAHLADRDAERPEYGRAWAARDRARAVLPRRRPNRTPPREVMRAGAQTLGGDLPPRDRRRGGATALARLMPDGDGALKAWTLLTALEELKGHEERVGKARRTANPIRADFRRPNWLDLRKQAARLRGPRSDCAGGGRRPGRIVDRGAAEPARRRHADRRSLATHRRQLAPALSRPHPAQPGSGQPPALHSLPAELADLHSEGQLAGWFEAYVESLELNYWPSTELLGGRYDERCGDAGPSSYARQTARIAKCIPATS